MSDSIGKVFVVTTSGESHGSELGAVIEGCPAGLSLAAADIQPQLDRRRPGQSKLATSRKESDLVEILAGVENGLTVGGAIELRIPNRNRRPKDYSAFENIPRPSHADFTYKMKYGARIASGGGRASARETATRVAAGAVAEKLLQEKHGVQIVAWVSAVGDIAAPDMTQSAIDRAAVDGNDVRCPDGAVAEQMISRIKSVRDDRDSVGGVVTCVCHGVPVGWGEPVFDKMEALLAAGMLSIPAAKGFEVGSGFAGARRLASENNDMFVKKGDVLGTVTNRSGGIQGGISNGEPIVFRVAFKPPPTISKPQQTVDFDGNPVTLEAGGRHDPCVVPRAVPVVEAMAALVLADLSLRA